MAYKIVVLSAGSGDIFAFFAPGTRGRKREINACRAFNARKIT